MNGTPSSIEVEQEAAAVQLLEAVLQIIDPVRLQAIEERYSHVTAVMEKIAQVRRSIVATASADAAVQQRLGALSIEQLRAKMIRAKDLSGLTGEEIGIRMGAEAKTARQVVNSLLHHTSNPGIFTLQKFANATGLSLIELLCLDD